MLSVIVITKNEAQHIRRCLSSVAWADEIIVFDSGSSDATVPICQEFTEQIYLTEWPGFGLQKQRALTKASHEWVLSIDADEEVNADLKAEMLLAMQNTDVQGFEIPRLSSYCGRQIKHAGWWPDYVLRLFRRDAGRFSEDLVHERIILTGQTQRLKHPLLHEAFINSEEVLSKINNYSSLGAEKLFNQNQKASVGLAIVKGLWTFFRTYFIKAGILDGSQGLMLAISNAEGSYYKYIKLRELNKQS